MNNLNFCSILQVSETCVFQKCDEPTESNEISQGNIAPSAINQSRGNINIPESNITMRSLLDRHVEDHFIHSVASYRARKMHVTDFRAVSQEVNNFLNTTDPKKFVLWLSKLSAAKVYMQESDVNVRQFGECLSVDNFIMAGEALNKMVDADDYKSLCDCFQYVLNQRIDVAKMFISEYCFIDKLVKVINNIGHDDKRLLEAIAATLAQQITKEEFESILAANPRSKDQFVKTDFNLVSVAQYMKMQFMQYSPS